MRNCVPLLACLFELSAITCAKSAQYKVDELALGDHFPSLDSGFRSYNCKQSDDFTRVTTCQRSQSRSVKGINYTATNTTLHTDDGIIVLLISKVTQRRLGKNEIVV